MVRIAEAGQGGGAGCIASVDEAGDGGGSGGLAGVAGAVVGGGAGGVSSCTGCVSPPSKFHKIRTKLKAQLCKQIGK